MRFTEVGRAAPNPDLAQLLSYLFQFWSPVSAVLLTCPLDRRGPALVRFGCLGLALRLFSRHGVGVFRGFARLRLNDDLHFTDLGVFLLPERKDSLAECVLHPIALEPRRCCQVNGIAVRACKGQGLQPFVKYHRVDFGAEAPVNARPDFNQTGRLITTGHRYFLLGQIGSKFGLTANWWWKGRRVEADFRTELSWEAAEQLIHREADVFLGFDHVLWL